MPSCSLECLSLRRRQLSSVPPNRFQLVRIMYFAEQGQTKVFACYPIKFRKTPISTSVVGRVLDFSQRQAPGKVTQLMRQSGSFSGATGRVSTEQGQLQLAHAFLYHRWPQSVECVRILGTFSLDRHSKTSTCFWGLVRQLA